MHDVDAEQLVEHFCLPKEAQALREWQLKQPSVRPKGFEARLALAQERRLGGNEHFRKGEWDKAVWLYLAALHCLDYSKKDTILDGVDESADFARRLMESRATVLSNMAAAFGAKDDNYNAIRSTDLGLFFAEKLQRPGDAREKMRSKLLYRRACAKDRKGDAAEDAYRDIVKAVNLDGSQDKAMLGTLRRLKAKAKHEAPAFPNFRGHFKDENDDDDANRRRQHEEEEEAQQRKEENDKNVEEEEDDSSSENKLEDATSYDLDEDNLSKKEDAKKIKKKKKKKKSNNNKRQAVASVVEEEEDFEEDDDEEEEERVSKKVFQKKKELNIAERRARRRSWASVLKRWRRRLLAPAMAGRRSLERGARKLNVENPFRVFLGIVALVVAFVASISLTTSAGDKNNKSYLQVFAVVVVFARIVEFLLRRKFAPPRPLVATPLRFKHKLSK